MINQEIYSFIGKCHEIAIGNNSDEDAIKLIRLLKDNPPMESLENPKLSDSQPTEDEQNLHNPFGHLQYFSSLFIDMFFGNYTEFNDYIKTLSKEELDKALKKRECSLFAPIIGLRMEDVERSFWFTSQQVKEIRTMYFGCNDHKYLEITKKCLGGGRESFCLF